MTEHSPWGRPDGDDPAQPAGPPPPAPGWAAPTPPATPPQYGPAPQYGPPAYGSPAVPVRKKRVGLWVGLGIGVVVLLCCVAVPLGFGGLFLLGNEMDKQDSISTLEDYLDAVVDEDYDFAYGLLCEEYKVDVSREEFAAADPGIVSYTVGDAAEMEEDGVKIGWEAEVDLSYADGTESTELYLVFTDGFSFDYQVCPPPPE